MTGKVCTLLRACTMARHLLIVGGGVAGLSAGCYAQRSGFRTTIVEHNLALGGVCTAWHRGPYTIDGCIHWLTGGPFIRRSGGRLTGHPPPVQSAGPEWLIEFVADPDGEIDEGTLLIDSELVLPAQPELGVGERTRRITTTVSQQRTTSREQTFSQERSPAAPIVFARLSYEDRGGLHTHEVVKDSITIGRGGITYPVDVRVSSSEDVSREHARIRRDPKTGRFFLIDLSLLGTTLDGRHVPRGYDTSDDRKRENGTETPLPDRGRIGLADTLYLDFERVR